MKKFPLLLMILGCLAVVACNSDGDDDDSKDYWSKYRKWREENTEWFKVKRDSLAADGTQYFQTVSPAWNPSAQILIHYHNDRSLTQGNLSPYLTSTAAVRYIGRLCTGEPFDSSYLLTANGPAIALLSPQNSVKGMAIALMDMRVGDTCTVVMPYELAYGGQMKGSILPYSALEFEVGMVDIPYYEIPE